MSPIVSPWWFYLFNLVESLRDGAFAVLLFGGMIIAFITMGNLIDCHTTKVKVPWWLSTLFALSIIIMLFVPTKETCYQMAAASLVTPDNLTAVGETAKNAIDYIVESVDKVLDGEEE